MARQTVKFGYDFSQENAKVTAPVVRDHKGSSEMVNLAIGDRARKCATVGLNNMYETTLDVGGMEAADEFKINFRKDTDKMFETADARFKECEKTGEVFTPNLMRFGAPPKAAAIKQKKKGGG